MLSRAFYRIFPVPTFLSMPYAGVDITDDAVRAVEYVHKGHIVEVGRTIEKKLAKGVVESGYIHDEAALTKVLKEVASELRTHYVKVSLPEEKLYLFKTEIPYTTNRAEMRQNIEFKLEENVPVSPADALFEFDVLPPAPHQPHGKTMEVSVSVAPDKAVHTYLSALNAAGLMTIAFELQAKAIAKAALPQMTGTQLIIDIMSSKTGISIVSHGIVCFTSTLSLGGLSIAEAIMKTFSLDESELDAFMKENAYKDSDKSKAVFESISNIASTMKDDASRILQYWKSRGPSHIVIDRIILCGKDSLITGLSGYLSSQLNLPVSPAQVWKAIEHKGYIPPLTYADSLNYARAAGLGL